MKRAADGEADDAARGDVDSVDMLECDHCGFKCESRNRLFKHLYQHHDDDGEGLRWKEIGRHKKGESAGDGRTCTDEIARPALHDQDAMRHRAISKLSFDPGKAGCATVKPLMAVEDFKGHPSPMLKTKEIDPDECKWKDIGSGMFARTFIQVSQLPFTTKGGPAASEVHRRVVRSLTSGKVIDDCVIDDVSDEQMRRRLPEPEDVRVELTMRQAIAMYHCKGADVVELFSQPRIAQEAGIRRYDGTQLKAGWSLDLTMRDPETDRPWDLSVKETQDKVRKMVVSDKPFMLIGSPPCTAFSQLQGLNNPKRDPEIVAKELAQAHAHILFCFEMYEIQRRSGRYFAHEHPSSASSWKLPVVLEMLLKEDVELIEIDMCDFGMTATDELGEALVRKRTKMLTNSPEVARRVARKCTGDHRHVHLVGGRAKRAQLYPRLFSRAVCEGVAAQKRLHGMGLEHSPIMSIEEIDRTVEMLTGAKCAASHLHEEEEIAIDDNRERCLSLGSCARPGKRK